MPSPGFVSPLWPRALGFVLHLVPATPPAGLLRCSGSFRTFAPPSCRPVLLGFAGFVSHPSSPSRPRISRGARVRFAPRVSVTIPRFVRLARVGSVSPAARPHRRRGRHLHLDPEAWPPGAIPWQLGFVLCSSTPESGASHAPAVAFSRQKCRVFATGPARRCRPSDARTRRPAPPHRLPTAPAKPPLDDQNEKSRKIGLAFAPVIVAEDRKKSNQ